MSAGGQRDSRLRTLWNRSHSLWSSFDVGPAHVLLLDSEAILWCNSQQNESAMLAFAEADLSAAAAPAARALRPWIVVVVHRPLYSSFNSTGEQAALRAPLAPLLERHAVDLVLSGHVHSYDRTWPVTGDYSETSNATVARSFVPPDTILNAPVPVHVVSGAAGNGESVDPHGRGLRLDLLGRAQPRPRLLAPDSVQRVAPAHRLLLRGPRRRHRRGVASENLMLWTAGSRFPGNVSLEAPPICYLNKAPVWKDYPYRKPTGKSGHDKGQRKNCEHWE